MKIFHGIDIREARRALVSLKIFDGRTVRENTTLFEQDIIYVDNAPNSRINTKDKLFYLYDQFTFDVYDSFKPAIATSKL